MTIKNFNPKLEKKSNSTFRNWVWVMVFAIAFAYDIRWRWYDMAVELNCGLLMIVSFCWDWKNIIQVPGDIERTGIPNPFAWWLYLPAYLFSITYFAVKLRQIIIFNDIDSIVPKLLKSDRKREL